MIVTAAEQISRKYNAKARRSIIRSIREYAGYSQEELAKLVGLSVQAISRYERGALNLSPISAERMHHALKGMIVTLNVKKNVEKQGRRFGEGGLVSLSALKASAKLGRERETQCHEIAETIERLARQEGTEEERAMLKAWLDAEQTAAWAHLKVQDFYDRLNEQHAVELAEKVLLEDAKSKLTVEGMRKENSED